MADWQAWGDDMLMDDEFPEPEPVECLTKEQMFNELRDAVANLLGFYDTPISRRRFPQDAWMKEAIEHARKALAAAKRNETVEVKEQRPFGHYFWRSNGDGTDSPEFCEGDIPRHKEGVRNVVQLYASSVPQPANTVHEDDIE